MQPTLEACGSFLHTTAQAESCQIAAPNAKWLLLLDLPTNPDLSDRRTVRVLDSHLGLLVFVRLDLGTKLHSAFNVFVLAFLHLGSSIAGFDTF